MNENVDIFINTIRDIEEYPNNSVYKLMCLGDCHLNNKYPLEIKNDNIGDNISFINKGMCEFTGMYWLWKNADLKDYVGFCQYRRFFEFYENIPNIEEIFQDHDIIVNFPIQFKKQTIGEQYDKAHNIYDLAKLSLIVKDKYPEYHNMFISFSKHKLIFASNLWIMKKDDFKRCCEFVWTIMKQFMEDEHITCYQDCIDKVNNESEKYIKKFSPNNTVDYQSRFLAYLVERLINVFILKNFHKMKYINAVETEGKYGKHVFKARKAT